MRERERERARERKKEDKEKKRKRRAPQKKKREEGNFSNLRASKVCLHQQRRIETAKPGHDPRLVHVGQLRAHHVSSKLVENKL